MSKSKTSIATVGQSLKHSQNVLQPSTLNAALFHPWFLPRSVFRTIAQLVPREYLIKMRDYYDRYGCMRCSRRDRRYRQNGMCQPCYNEVARRLRRCLKRRFGVRHKLAANSAVRHLLQSEKIARELLQDLIPAERAAARSCQRKYDPKNPTNSMPRLTALTRTGPR